MSCVLGLWPAIDEASATWRRQMTIFGCSITREGLLAAIAIVLMVAGEGIIELVLS